jgi:hypothetical protein
MPEPVSDHITTTPNADAPYSAVDSDRSTEPWRKLTMNSGKADIHDGHITAAGFEDSPPWRQV